MAQLAPIVINDGAATPLAHTFSPIGKPAGAVFDAFVERTTGKVDFQKEIRLKTSAPTVRGGPSKVVITMLLPITKLVDGVEVLDYQNRLDLTVTCAANGITQSRKDLRKMLVNLLDNSQIVAAIDNLENTY